MPGRLDPLAPYLPPVVLQFLRRQSHRIRRSVPEAVTGETATFHPDEIEAIRELFCTVGTAEGGPWDRLRHAHMPLPAWFREGLDPWSAEYRAQQERLWQLITAVDRPYSPDADEVEAFPADIDAIRTPAFYGRRDAEAIASASDHVLATGMLLRHCGLVAGDHAIEYGAGFGQTALALARLGVNVETVDISRSFCRWVQEQADFFRVPLRAHHGHFGVNPRPGHRYKVVWFYESFHHCWNFEQVVPKLAAMLEDGGRVILGGEPVFERPYAAVPYPWGVRLHSEVAAVMRQTRWMELGFTEPFLYELFARSGFSGRRVDCEPSRFGQLYIFERPARVPPTGAVQRWDFASPQMHSAVGQRAGSAVQADGRAGYLGFGPYAPWSAGPSWAEIRLDPAQARSGSLLVDVVSATAKDVHVARRIDLNSDLPPTLWLSFDLPEAVADIQVRVYCEAETQLRLLSVGLSAEPGTAHESR